MDMKAHRQGEPPGFERLPDDIGGAAIPCRLIAARLADPDLADELRDVATDLDGYAARVCEALRGLSS